MSKIVIFSFPTSGHINPTLTMIKELVKRGKKVIRYSAEPYQKIVESTGAIFRSYSNFVFSEEYKPKCTDNGGESLRKVDMTYQTAAALLLCLPCIIFLFIFQRTLTRGVTAAGIKG